MTHYSSSTDDLLSEYGLDGDEIRKRKRFLEFDDADIAYLRDMHDFLQPHQHAFADAFYAYLHEFPETRRLLSQEGILERLKRTQAQYFEELTAGTYGDGYVGIAKAFGSNGDPRFGAEPDKEFSDLFARVIRLGAPPSSPARI